MTPPSPYRPLNIALVLALCAVILSARLLMGYMHTGGSVSPVPAEPAESVGHYGELPPAW